MTYKKRNLKFQFTLKEGAFDEKGNNILTIDNIKAEVEMGAYGGVAGSELNARVFGLSMANMALLSYKGRQLSSIKQNMIKVWADGVPLFLGSITNCFADMNQMPDAPLIISAFATGFEQTINASPFSAEGSVDVATAIDSIAKTISYTVVNNGVNAKLSGVYFRGDPISQIRQICNAAGINSDFRLGVIYIWPQNGRVDDVRPYVSKSSGLIGYPVPSGYGMNFTSTFSNLFCLGRQVTLDTELPNASGEYTVISANHHLSTWMEGGPWCTVVYAASTDLGVITQ